MLGFFCCGPGAAAVVSSSAAPRRVVGLFRVTDAFLAAHCRVDPLLILPSERTVPAVPLDAVANRLQPFLPFALRR